MQFDARRGLAFAIPHAPTAGLVGTCQGTACPRDARPLGTPTRSLTRRPSFRNRSPSGAPSGRRRRLPPPPGGPPRAPLAEPAPQTLSHHLRCHTPRPPHGVRTYSSVVTATASATGPGTGPESHSQSGIGPPTASAPAVWPRASLAYRCQMTGTEPTTPQAEPRLVVGEFGIERAASVFVQLGQFLRSEDFALHP